MPITRVNAAVIVKTGVRQSERQAWRRVAGIDGPTRSDSLGFQLLTAHRTNGAGDISAVRRLSHAQSLNFTK